MEGNARIDPAGPDASANPAYLAKYLPNIQGYGWTAEYVRGRLQRRGADHADPLARGLTRR